MKEISYMPVGRVRRRKKDWRRIAKDLVADAAIILVIGVLVGAGFGLGLGFVSAAGMM